MESHTPVAELECGKSFPVRAADAAKIQKQDAPPAIEGAELVGCRSDDVRRADLGIEKSEERSLFALGLKLPRHLKRHDAARGEAADAVRPIWLQGTNGADVIGCHGLH